MYSTLQLRRLHGIEAVMVAKLNRAEKRMCITVDDSHDTGVCKRTVPFSTSIDKSRPPSCFFCEQSAGSEQLHEGATFTINRHVRDCVTLLRDS